MRAAVYAAIALLKLQDRTLCEVLTADGDVDDWELQTALESLGDNVTDRLRSAFDPFDVLDNGGTAARRERPVETPRIQSPEDEDSLPGAGAAGPDSEARPGLPPLYIQVMKAIIANVGPHPPMGPRLKNYDRFKHRLTTDEDLLQDHRGKFYLGVRHHEFFDGQEWIEEPPGGWNELAVLCGCRSINLSAPVTRGHYHAVQISAEDARRWITENYFDYEAWRAVLEPQIQPSSPRKAKRS